MKTVIQFIACTYILACFAAGCSQPSAPIATDEPPVNSDTRTDSTAFAVSKLAKEPLTVFTKRVDGAPSWVQATLDRDGQTSFDSATLPEVVASLREKELYDVPITLAERALATIAFDLTKRFSLQLKGTPLRIGLQRFLQSSGLVCDYRFERLVITTADDAQSWADQTGVTALKPSPDSRWTSLLDDEHGVEFYDVLDLADELKIHYGVDVEVKMTSRDSSQRGLFSIHDARVPNRHWMRILLGRQDLTCRLNGETLVIEPLGD